MPYKITRFDTSNTRLKPSRLSLLLKICFKLGSIDRFVYTAPAYRGETALYFYI